MATRPTDIPLTDIRVIRSRAMDTRVTPDTLLTPVLQAMDTKATRDSLLSPDPRPMDRRADRGTLPIPVLVMEIRWLVIPEIALWRTGRLEPSTVSSLLAEFRPEITLNPRRRCSGEDERLRKAHCPPQDSATLDRSIGTRTDSPSYSGIGSFILAGGPSRLNLVVQPTKSGLPGDFPQ